MKDGVSCFGAMAAKRPLDKADGIRLPQRKWRVATENEMRRVDTVGLKGSAQIRRLKRDGVVEDRLKIGGQRTFKTGGKPRIGVELSLHARPQQWSKAAEMRAAEPQTRVSIQQPAEDHVKDIEGGIEKITADDSQFVIARPVAGRRIGRMNDKRNIQLGRRVEDWREFFRIQIAALDVRRQIATDQAKVAHGPVQFTGCRLWVLHRQERPSVECVRRGSVDSR